MRPACLPRHLALKHAASRPGEGLPDDLDSGDLDLKAAPRHGKPQVNIGWGDASAICKTTGQLGHLLAIKNLFINVYIDTFEQYFNIY